MSNAVLKGNASGTGTVTLETPDTNSDRTISLPDADGAVVLTDVDGTVALAATGSNIITASTNGAERMRIDSSGNLLVGTTETISGFFGSKIQVACGNNNGINIQTTTTAANSSVNIWNATDSGTRSLVNFYTNTSRSLKGSISSNGSTTSYNTSSDYRLKENIAPMTGALNKVAQLKPVTYKWKVDGSASQGFIAHELAEVVPDCVTGEKDAVDAEGNPVYQGIDTSFLVATLTAAIQELKAELDATKAEVAALKGAE
jgi:hypothetical protein